MHVRIYVCMCVCVCIYIDIYIYIYRERERASRHSAAEHRASTRIFHLTLFLASVFVERAVRLIPVSVSLIR